MSTQKEFEACLGYPYDFSKDQYGAYNDVYVQYMWVGWKMSHNKYHKDIKVNLPKIRKLRYDGNDNPYNPSVCLYEDDFYEVQELKDALDEAGVKY